MIALIVPPFTRNRASPRYSFDESPNIGLAYIAEHLRRSGHEVTVVDGIGEGLGRATQLEGRDFVVHGLTPDQIVQRVPAGPAIIGVTLPFSQDWKVQKILLRRLRASFPEALIVVGGEHATADAEFILRSGAGVDLCVLGEGEAVIAEIAADPATARLRKIPGTAHLENGRYLENPRRARMEIQSDLRPAWDLFPIEKYMRFRSGMNVVNRSTLPIMASRGCPHSCTFCTSPKMWGYRYVVRDPAEIVREMKDFHERYGNDHFVFTDLSMTIKRDWTIALARAIIDSGLRVTWHFGVGTRTELMDAEVIPLLKRSGLLKLSFVAESGSDETLKRIRKRVNLGKMFASMRLAVQHGIPARTTFIYGLPGQTLREAFKSLRFSLRLAWIGFDEVTITFFMPYPGSELHAQLLASGAIPDKIGDPAAYERFLDSLDLHNLSGRTWGELSATTLKAFYVLTHASFLAFSFLIHPGKALRVLRNVRRRKPVTNFEGILFNKLHARKRFAADAVMAASHG